MARRRRPLGAVILVFVGFLTLVVLAQASVHFFSAAIPHDLKARNEAVLAGIERTSSELAVAASALGLVFAGAVMVITRPVIASDLDVYRATGLPLPSAYARLLRSHSLGPLGWIAAAASAAVLVDRELGLDALVPIGLAACFAILIFAWLGFVASASFSGRAVGGGSREMSG